VSFSLDALGRVVVGPRYEVTAEALDAYAAATDDAPGGPVFAVVPVLSTIAEASRSIASDDVRARVVHYEQDIVVHRALEPGMAVVPNATPVSLLPRPNGTSLVIHVVTWSDDGGVVNEQYVTEFFRDVIASETVGERAPAHALDIDDLPPLAEIRYPVDDDLPVRYAEASGDTFAIHLDDEFARSLGLPGRIVHGLCTMAFAGRAVLDAVGVGDPGAIRRLAARFSAPLFPGDTLTTTVWELADGVYGFIASRADGTPVVKDGRAELR
jgi:acyl dehydratase